MDFFIISIWQVEALQYDYIFCIQNSKPWYINHSFQLRTSISKYLCQFSGSTCSLSSTRISCYCCHLLDSLKLFVISIEGHNLDNPYLNLNLQPKYITVVTKGWSKPSIPGNEFNSLIAPLFDQRLYIANAVPSGTRLVTTLPHP